MARKTGSIGDVTAQKVREAALGLIARHGYAAVSMRAIAAEVGLQASALYNHFPTKQDLLASLMTAHMQALIVEWETGQRE
ncbi:MAG: helix-turn-helix transcriptional regulator, partial [Nitratireductor sp.]|nr:helix-turn-helix transcriptional regulator [Nitratireductor sp.]